jgi:HEAT repeat protein
MRSLKKRILAGLIALLLGLPLLGWVLYQAPAVRRSVAWEARHLGSAAVPYLRRALVDADPKVRIAAVMSLSSQPMGAAGVPELIGVLAGDRADMRLAALGGIRCMGEQAKAATSVLIATLDDPDSRIRAAAAEAFYFFGPAGQPAIPALLDCLEDEEADVRMAAVGTLCRVSGEEGQPQLVTALSDRLLRDADARVRQETARWLPVLGPAAAVALTQALDDPAKEVRLAAEQSLQSLAAAESARQP